MNNTMNRFFMALALGVLVLSVSAQPPKGEGPDFGQMRGKERREWVEAQKVAFITDRLELTPTESEKFWPLYRQYWAEELALAHEKRRLFARMSDGSLTAVVAESDLASLVGMERKRAALMERYGKIFAGVLPWQKVARFFVEQENFKGYLLRNHVRK